MKEETKVYLFAGVLYAIICKFPIETFNFWLAYAMYVVLWIRLKHCILSDLRKKKVKQYEDMVEGMAKYFEECKEKGEENALDNMQVFDGKELKPMKDVIKEKQDAENEDKTTRSDSGNEDKT